MASMLKKGLTALFVAVTMSGAAQQLPDSAAAETTAAKKPVPAQQEKPKTLPIENLLAAALCFAISGTIIYKVATAEVVRDRDGPR